MKETVHITNSERRGLALEIHKFYHFCAVVGIYFIRILRRSHCEENYTHNKPHIQRFIDISQTFEASICIFHKNMKEIAVLKETMTIEKPNLDRMLGVQVTELI